MKRFILAIACLVPVISFAQSKAAPAAEFLTEAEALDGCAEALPKQLECKQEFCNAMVDIRKKLQPRFAAVEKAEMVTACLGEIAVDGTGDLQARRDRCAGWAKGRPPMKFSRADLTASNACFAKATCGERIGCWAPITQKQMASMTPPKKK
jgi:hypothetical protein